MLTVLGLLALMTNGDNYAAAPLFLKISEDLGISLRHAVLGTAVNGQIMLQKNFNTIFFNFAFILLVVGIIAAIFIEKFERRQQKASLLILEEE